MYICIYVHNSSEGLVSSPFVKGRPHSVSLFCHQGCQIFVDEIYQNGEKYFKLTNGHKLHPMVQLYLPNDPNIFLMVLNFTNIFHCKKLQNLPKVGFLVRKYPNPVCHSVSSSRLHDLTHPPPHPRAPRTQRESAEWRPPPPPPGAGAATWLRLPRAQRRWKQEFRLQSRSGSRRRGWGLNVMISDPVSTSRRHIVAKKTCQYLQNSIAKNDSNIGFQ
jgi:hypothetical protein